MAVPQLGAYVIDLDTEVNAFGMTNLVKKSEDSLQEGNNRRADH